MAVSLTGSSVDFGALNGASLFATATAGNVTGRSVTVGGDAKVGAASGSILLGGITAANGATSLAAGQRVTAGDITSGGAVSLTGSSVGFGALNAASLFAEAGSGDVTGVT